MEIESRQVTTKLHRNREAEAIAVQSDVTMVPGQFGCPKLIKFWLLDNPSPSTWVIEGLLKQRKRRSWEIERKR